MPGKKKKYNARFPPARIKKIMQTDEDVGKVAAAVPVIISRSLELFIDSLIERTASVTRAKNAKTLSTSHIKQAIHSEKTFDFLRDLVKAIPDHQVDEEGEGPGGPGASGGGPSQEKKPKTTRPRKPREEGAPTRGRGRPRKVKPEPEVKKSSSSDEEDDEETETDEEGLTSQEEAGPTNHTSSNSPAHISPVTTNSAQASSSPAFISPSQGTNNLGIVPNQAVPTSNNLAFLNPAKMSGGIQESMANTPGFTSNNPAFSSPGQMPSNPGPMSSVPATYPNPVLLPTQPPPQISLTQPHGQPAMLDQSQPTAVSSQAPVSAPHNSTASSQPLSHPNFSQPLMTQNLFQAQLAFPMHNFQFPQYMVPPGGPQLGPPMFMPPSSSSISPQHSPLPPNMAPGIMPYPPPYMAPHSPFHGRPEGPAMGPNGTRVAPYAGHTQPGQPTSTAGQSTGQPASKAEPTNSHDANMPLDMSIPGKSRHPSQSQSQGGVGPGQQQQPAQPTSAPVHQGLPALVPQGYPGAAPHPQAAPAPYPTQHLTRLPTQPNPVHPGPPQVNDSVRPQGHGQHAQNVYPPHARPPTNFYNQPQENKAISLDTKTDNGKEENSSVSHKSNTAEVIDEVNAGTGDQVKGMVSFPGLSNIMKVNSIRPVNNGDDDDYDT